MRPSPLLLGVALTGLLTSCSAGAATPTPSAAAKASYHGVQPAPEPSRPEYVLKDTTGATYDFQKQTKGHPTFVYFGYTHCPDQCPTAMSDVASALRKASSYAKDVKVVFVTTDPARDTAPVLRRWLDQFSTSFVGLLGTPQQLADAQVATGISAAQPGGPVPTISGHPDQHVHQPGTAPHKHFGPLGYSVDHSAVIFAYDAADRLPVLYPGGVTPSDIAADLPVLAHPR